MRIFRFLELHMADLIVDAIYEGGIHGNAGDDPISKLIGVGNQGGFRYSGSPTRKDVKLCVLYSELTDPDWPDALYPETGIFIYYGDNKRPGHLLHDTKPKGNLLLSNVFENLHTGHRDRIPPFFLFSKAGTGRDVRFRGLAVPGAKGMSQTEDLVAIWKTSKGSRFQNYRAIFSVLDVARIHRSWLDDLKSGNPLSAYAPSAWKEWVQGGRYKVLLAERSITYRTRQQQLPNDPLKMQLLLALVGYFKAHPEREYAFEACAGELVKLMDRNFTEVDLTRPWKDGGRDAIGKYNIGTMSNSLAVEFALEAKCKEPGIGNSSGVKEISRLISRLRHRQFGVFVTTSCVHEQAYKEIVEDGHPVMILSGEDLASILLHAGISSEPDLLQWLGSNFPEKSDQ